MPSIPFAISIWAGHPRPDLKATNFCLSILFSRASVQKYRQVVLTAPTHTHPILLPRIGSVSGMRVLCRHTQRWQRWHLSPWQRKAPGNCHQSCLRIPMNNNAGIRVANYLIWAGDTAKNPYIYLFIYHFICVLQAPLIFISLFMSYIYLFIYLFICVL